MMTKAETLILLRRINRALDDANVIWDRVEAKLKASAALSKN